MAVTSYHTADGQILGQTASGVRTQYLTDALGSVTETVADDGSVLNTYRYKPYGAQLAKTGVGADPKFLFVGSRRCRVLGSTMCSGELDSLAFDSSLGTYLSTIFRRSGPKYNRRPLILDERRAVANPEVPFVDHCGQALWLVHWILDPLPSSSTKGAVVQRVTLRFQIWNCKTGETVESVDTTYDEMWEMDGGKWLKPPGWMPGDKNRFNEDQFRAQSKECTSGYRIWIAYFDWREGYSHLKDAPWTFDDKDHSGGLWTHPPTTKPDPTQCHYLFYQWNCCDPPEARRIAMASIEQEDGG